MDYYDLGYAIGMEKVGGLVSTTKRVASSIGRKLGRVFKRGKDLPPKLLSPSQERARTIERARKSLGKEHAELLTKKLEGIEARKKGSIKKKYIYGY